MVRRSMASRKPGARTPKRRASKTSENDYPFPYLGHGLGSASNDLVIHAVFERDPAKIPKKTFDPFPVARSATPIGASAPSQATDPAAKKVLERARVDSNAEVRKAAARR